MSHPTPAQQPQAAIITPGYYAAPKPPTSGLAVTSMVLGIITLVAAICSFGLLGLFAVIGLVFGHVALSNIARTGKSGRGMAIAGLVTGYIALAPAIFLIFSAAAGTAATP